jgi:transposase
MEITYTHCAGLDVHKKTVVACCITVGMAGEKQQAIRTFGTMTVDLLALSDWLLTLGVSHVAMESTGEFWKPVYNILEGNFELLVVNAKHIKNVPGRKTDVKDAEWIAELLRHGLLRGSFIPPQAQRDLRDLTRQRTNLVQDRATVVNRLQKVCEWSNLKLSAVATDITGVSARAMLQAILAGQTEPQTLADLAQGRLRNKRHELERALNGVVRDHHRFMLAQHLAQIDFLDEQIARYDDQIAQHMAQGAPDHSPEPPASPPTSIDMPDDASVEPSLSGAAPLTWQEAISLLDTIPGVNRRMAELLLAEIGIDMSRFPSAAHLASWAKVAPGNNESAGKHYSAATGHGNRWLRTAIVQAAWAAVKVKNSYLAAFYHRLAARRGAKRAIFAVAHRILTAIYHMLSKREVYHDLGVTYLDERNKPKLLNRIVRRLEQLGFQVNIEPIQSVVA